jgi:hypothetical protein
MKKKVLVLFFVSVLLISFVSAGWFGDLLDKLFSKEEIQLSPSANLNCPTPFGNVEQDYVKYFDFNSPLISGEDYSVGGESGTIGNVEGIFSKGGNLYYNKYIAINGENNLGITDSMSISSWVYPKLDEGSYGYLTSKKNSDAFKFLFSRNNENVQINFYELVSEIPNEEWSFVTGVIDSSGNAKLYVASSVNGPILEERSTSGIVSNDERLIIGNAEKENGEMSFQYYKGYLDEFALWKRALSEDEVYELYKQGRCSLTDRDGDCYSTDPICGAVDCDDDFYGYSVPRNLRNLIDIDGDGNIGEHINPGARDVCDGIDNNCDGFIDQDRLRYYNPSTSEICDVNSIGESYEIWNCEEAESVVLNTDTTPDTTFTPFIDDLIEGLERVEGNVIGTTLLEQFIANSDSVYQKIVIADEAFQSGAWPAVDSDTLNQMLRDSTSFESYLSTRISDDVEINFGRMRVEPFIYTDSEDLNPANYKKAWAIRFEYSF